MASGNSAKMPLMSKKFEPPKSQRSAARRKSLPRGPDDDARKWQPPGFRKDTPPAPVLPAVRNGQEPGVTSAEPTTTFDFGYCLTVHKAQGSEWPRVLLIDEYNNTQHRTEWLYTGLTRAARSIVVVPA
jgi:hypothetical protein